MDRIDLILAALASGVYDKRDAPSDEVQSAHADLKGLIKRHFGDRADAELALEEYEQKPDSSRKRLKEVFEATGVTEEFAIAAAAQQLLKLADPEGASSGKYAVQAKSLGTKIGH